MVYPKQNKRSNCKEKSLLSLFRNMIDFRRMQGKLHDIETILMIVMMGIMSGYCGYQAIDDFKTSKKDKLLRYLKPRKKILPSKDTIRRTILNINFEELCYVFKIWAEQFIEFDEKEWLSFDGKAIKNTLPEETHKLVTLVTFFVHKSKTVLLQGKINEKSNEIPLVQELLDELKYTKLVITGDALHTQKDTVEKIDSSKNFYVLNVKNNQSNLLEKISFIGNNMSEIDSYTSIDKSRGRIESREIKIYENDFEKDLEYLGWKNVKRIIKVKRTVYHKKRLKLSQETLYYISNLEATAKEFGIGIRNHWLIESMHWIKDVVFNEDSARIHTGNSAENFSILRDFVISVLRLNGFNKISQATRILNGNIKEMLNLLGGGY